MKKIVEHLSKMPVTAVSDALKGRTNLNPAIQPVKEELRIFGRAHTVKVRAADNKLVLQGIAEAKKGDVLVVDARGWRENAACGDFVVGLAKTLGLAGMVIDGAVRDLAGIRELDYPVFCLGTTQAASGRHGTGETGVPISCGGAVVNPGDLIIGDLDGVAVIPAGEEERVLKGALEKIEADEAREKKFLQNEETARAYLDDVLK